MRAALGTEWTDGCGAEWPVAEHANTESVDLPPMEDAAELNSEPINLPLDAIEGVLHRGAKMVLGGGSKNFKTWTLIDLAISVATGTEWLGEIPHKAGTRSVYKSGIASAFFAKRLRDVCEKEQFTLERGYLTVWNLRGYAADLSKLRPLLLQGIGRNE